MLTQEQTKQFSDILEELGKTLDVSESQFKAAVSSYEAVGKWLSKEDSVLFPYKPEILPQGSFMLGTMIKPEHEKDDLDVDLVCQLTGKRPEWTQFDLKQKVGDRLKLNDKYKEMLSKTKEGRRCWTMHYSDAANYHLDILPCLISEGYKVVLAKSFSAREFEQTDNLAIRITDKKEANYNTATNPEEWLKSNPFGFSRWFFDRADLSLRKAGWISESIQPVPVFRADKLPLQRVVQILKRHRDMIFNGNEHKPISMIITTLAAKSYGKEINITDALLSVAEKMPKLIEERFSAKHGKYIKWISNPVNEEENFADKWSDHPEREVNFYKWMEQVRIDIIKATQQIGLDKIQESLNMPFGKDVILKSFASYGEKQRILTENGSLKMAMGTGILGSVGRTEVRSHNFYGTHE